MTSGLIVSLSSACSFEYPDVVSDSPTAIFYLDLPTQASADATFSVASYFADTFGSPTTYALPDTFTWKVTAPYTITVSGMGKSVSRDPRNPTASLPAFTTTVGSRSLDVSLPIGTYSIEIAPANFQANLLSTYPGYPSPTPTRSLVVR